MRHYRTSVVPPARHLLPVQQLVGKLVLFTSNAPPGYLKVWGTHNVMEVNHIRAGHLDDEAYLQGGGRRGYVPVCYLRVVGQARAKEFQ